MKLKRDARTLKSKALCSLRRALSAFNAFDEDGRVTSVLLHLQHASEMLLKAALIQKGVKVFDRKDGRSLGFDKCVNLATEYCKIKPEDAGLIRAIDSLRDAEQHWLVVVSEQILYLHARAFVTVFDDILKRIFDDALAAHLPSRVLPVSTMPPGNIEQLVDKEYSQIKELLRPGRRARDEARGRIRTLLAIESHVADEVAVSERDIDRVERAIRSSKTLKSVFPRLMTLGTATSGDGIEVKVHITRKHGAPIQFTSGDDPEGAAAIRELDLQKKFHLSALDLAKAVGLNGPKSAALRSHLAIDEDKQCTHEFEFGRSKFRRYSDNATRKMKEAVQTISMDEVWSSYRAKSGFGGRRSGRKA